jgi:hypothetical protein
MIPTRVGDHRFYVAQGEWDLLGGTWPEAISLPPGGAAVRQLCAEKEPSRRCHLQYFPTLAKQPGSFLESVSHGKLNGTGRIRRDWLSK